MLKRLFGKKEVKPQSLVDAKEQLLESIREESLNKNAQQNFDYCLEYLKEASKEEIDDFASSLYSLIITLPIVQSSLAFTICASLFERGYKNDNLTDQIVELYASHLENSKPFFELLHQRVKVGEEGESDSDIDVDSLYNELIKDRALIPHEVALSVVTLDRLSQSLINIISIETTCLSKAKLKLKERVAFTKGYSQGVFWINRLFEVLFDEPIVVIDVDNHIGFEGKISGVNDNSQLQHLLMALPELNEYSVISEQDLSVINGTGIHISSSTIDGKWNMYNLEIIDQEDWENIKLGPAKTLELQDFWIWGEGIPQEISMHKGKRVVLLGRPSFKRTSRVQRTFKNMKANVEVEKVLSDEEINTWLGLKN